MLSVTAPPVRPSDVYPPQELLKSFSQLTHCPETSDDYIDAYNMFMRLWNLHHNGRKAQKHEYDYLRAVYRRVSAENPIGWAQLSHSTLKTKGNLSAEEQANRRQRQREERQQRASWVGGGSLGRHAVSAGWGRSSTTATAGIGRPRRPTMAGYATWETSTRTQSRSRGRTSTRGGGRVSLHLRGGEFREGFFHPTGGLSLTSSPRSRALGNLHHQGRGGSRSGGAGTVNPRDLILTTVREVDAHFDFSHSDAEAEADDDLDAGFGLF